MGTVAGWGVTVLSFNMSFCQEHWDQLKAAIIARGLGDLIARDGKELLGHIEGHQKTGEIGQFTIISFPVHFWLKSPTKDALD